MKLAEKGKILPPPKMSGLLGQLSEEIQSWPHIIAATHWDLNDASSIDGADFYVADHEIGHIHLFGEVHIATDAAISAAFIEQKKADPFRYRADPKNRYWTQIKVSNAHTYRHALELFKANYERILKKLA